MITKEIDCIPANSRVFIYGVGSAGKSLFMWLKKCRSDVRILGFIDSFASGRIARQRIYRFDSFLDEIQPERYDFIVVASGANAEIVRRLEDSDIKNVAVISIPSYLMENLWPIPLAERLREWKLRWKRLWVKRENIHLFFGEHGGTFIGNNKYYYLYLKEQYLKEQRNSRIYWVAENKTIIDALKSSGIDVLDFNDTNVTDYLFKASYFYFDNMTWQRKYPWLRFFKAKMIHMSHGVGLKLTERMLIPEAFMNSLTPSETRQLDSKIFKNDLLISTSDFYARNVSSPAYSTPLDRIICSGYPKNDIFYRERQGETIFTDVEIIDNIDALKKENYKIIVYAPTFRDMDSSFMYADSIDDTHLNRYLVEHKLILVIKGHTSINTNKIKTKRFFQKEPLVVEDNIWIYQNDRDGYPLLKRADLLITDYSSIYMDFLHARKPVVFFVYDYDDYITHHRDIQFDYETMTPGPKAKNYNELIRWISHFLVDGKDGFESERKRIFDLAFTHHDGESSARIEQAILKLG
ncbi:MAG: CDP-glycerol glycerophosphotransferase family protein [Candidatus Omnitrophota bacterium]